MGECEKEQLHTLPMGRFGGVGVAGAARGEPGH